MKSKGITLIGLIVTIVVITVVAGVSINVMTNAGIIEKTRKASKEYQYESEKEQWQLAIIGAKDFATEIVDEEKLEEELVNWRHEEDKWISPTGNEFKLREKNNDNNIDKYYICYYEGEDDVEEYAIEVKADKDIPEPVIYFIDKENNTACIMGNLIDLFDSELKEYILTEDIYPPDDNLLEHYEQIESGTKVMSFGNTEYEKYYFIYNGIIYVTLGNCPIPFEYDPNFKLGKFIEESEFED